MDQWETPHRAALLKAHKKGNAKVTRVFIFNNREEIDKRTKIIMAQQANHGIDVKIYINEETAFSFPPEIQKDFTVLDDGPAIGVTTAFF